MRGPPTPLSHDCWDWVALQRGTAPQAEKEQHCACVSNAKPPSGERKRATLNVSESDSSPIGTAAGLNMLLLQTQTSVIQL